MKKENSKIYWLIFIGVAMIAAIAIFCVWLPYRNKTSAPGRNQDTNKEAPKNFNSNTEPNDSQSSDDYYEKGVREFENKDYSLAVFYLSEAIRSDPKNVKAYVKKSEALYNQNDKNGSVQILKDGLLANPNDSQLKSRLDTLQIDPRATDYSL